MQRGFVLDFSQEGRVLFSVLLTPFCTVMRSQVLSGPAWIRSVPCDGVQLVVAYDRLCGTRVHHGPHGIDRANLCRPSIDKVAHEDGRTLLMSPRAAPVAVAEQAQKVL